MNKDVDMADLLAVGVKDGMDKSLLGKLLRLGGWYHHSVSYSPTGRYGRIEMGQRAERRNNSERPDDVRYSHQTIVS